jgi:hypothetical protein
MLRLAIVCIFAVATTGAAFGSDIPAKPHVKRHARANLPAGFPHAHYKYRTTVTWRGPVTPPVYLDRDPDVLFTPTLFYYGGPGYWDRIPYVCAAYGYC